MLLEILDVKIDTFLFYFIVALIIHFGRSTQILPKTLRLISRLPDGDEELLKIK